MHVFLAVGTRPDAIKMAPLYLQLAKEPRVQVSLCNSGQHPDLCAEALLLFDIVADSDLSVHRRDNDLAALFSAAFTAFSDHLRQRRPDRVLVHGDTTTAFAASMAAFHLGIPVGHVEAGLRTYSAAEPWPEEQNRQGIARIADMHFAPTAGSRENLLAERVSGRVIVTGNTVVDAMHHLLARQEPVAGNIGLQKLVLVTVHRRENQGSRLETIAKAVLQLAERADIRVVLPLHPNVKTRAGVTHLLGSHPSVELIEPLPASDFLRLMMQASLVLTDSGGVQEEATALGKPLLILRDVTERAEALQNGRAHLVGTTEDKIIAAATLHLDSIRPVHQPVPNPFGDGHAARRIVRALTGQQVSEFQPPFAGPDAMTIRVAAL